MILFPLGILLSSGRIGPEANLALPSPANFNSEGVTFIAVASPVFCTSIVTVMVCPSLI